MTTSPDAHDSQEGSRRPVGESSSVEPARPLAGADTPRTHVKTEEWTEPCDCHGPCMYPPTERERALEAALRLIVARAAVMGVCSQTGHEHLSRDAIRALAALAAQPDAAYWTPEVAERIGKALDDHKAGKSVPFQPDAPTERERALLRRFVDEYDEDNRRPPSFVTIEAARAALARPTASDDRLFVTFDTLVDVLPEAQVSIWPDFLRDASREHQAQARAALLRDSGKLAAAIVRALRVAQDARFAVQPDAPEASS